MEKEKKLFRKYLAWGVITGIVLLFVVIEIFIPKSQTNNQVIDNGVAVSFLTTEEIKSQSQKIDYAGLMRDSEANLGKLVYYRGKIVQVSEEDGDYVLRIATRGTYEDVIMASYSGERLLDGDTVDLWGIFIGLISYEAVLGNQITVPGISVQHLERLNSNTPFSQSLAKNTQEGITLSLDGYKFKKINDNWGKITEIRFTLENKGAKNIYPNLLLEVYEGNNRDNLAQKKIELSEFLYENDFISKTIPLDFGVAKIENKKTIKLSAYESYSKSLVQVYLEDVNLSNY